MGRLERSAKNMRPYSQQAFELKMGIEAGVVTSSEVISWADETLSKHDYDDDLANISMASEASPKDLIILIGQVVDQRDEIQAMRNVMGRIYKVLKQQPERAHSFTRFLERFWIEQDYDVPKDMDFICGVDDEFALAQQGIYGNVKKATKTLISNLSKYE